MTPLPEQFVDRIAYDLGATEGSALCAALDSAAPTSVRYNPYKITAKPAGEAVPWSRYGLYLDERPQFTLDSDFHAGTYYVQEAGSQFVGHLLGNLEMQGRRVLDLCAAPGGKTTLYATLVGAEGLVVANEIDRRRASVLADNVRKWGLGNVAVTTNEPKHLAQFQGWFDVVAVDAPCSGEGMFRKTEEARSEWNENIVQLCAARQTEILHEAWHALKAGGTLVYSTCTFNHTEDEEILAELSAWAADEVVESESIDVDEQWGVRCGRVGAFQTFRFFPHKTKSEGFFAAVARKAHDAGGKTRTPKPRKTIFTTIDRATLHELERWVAQPEFMCFAAIGDGCYGYYTAQFDAVRQLAESLSVITSGVEMGQVFKGLLKPDPALALFCGLNRKAVPATELNAEDALRFLRKQEVEASQFVEGVNLVCAKGQALGFVKRIGNRINNMYPNSLRIVKQ
ncbi:MAG: SAM-dependent methyltransferase [Alistipes sp.]